jgi:hypothetical protein
MYVKPLLSYMFLPYTRCKGLALYFSTLIVGVVSVVLDEDNDGVVPMHHETGFVA